jgi:Tfp pilus assembly protein PilF
MRMIGFCRKHQGDRAGATAWFLRCCAEDPWLRENWLELAQMYYEGKDWSGGYHACERALAIRDRSRHYLSYGYAWGERLDDLASVCAWYMGLKDKAAEHLRAALAVNPGDARLQGNAEWILPERSPPANATSNGSSALLTPNTAPTTRADSYFR